MELLIGRTVVLFLNFTLIVLIYAFIKTSFDIELSVLSQ